MYLCVDVCPAESLPSGLSWRLHLRLLVWLLMLEVLLEQAWSGIVPITKGNDRFRFNPPGTST